MIEIETSLQILRIFYSTSQLSPSSSMPVNLSLIIHEALLTRLFYADIRISSERADYHYYYTDQRPISSIIMTKGEAKPNLGQLEEDDEFEEFPVEEWKQEETDQSDLQVLVLLFSGLKLPVLF